MKIKSTWSKVGYYIGGCFSLLSAIRYFVVYPDIDRAIVYVLIGGIICSLAWLYNKHLEKLIKLAALQDAQNETDILLKEKGIIKEDLIETE